MAGIMDEYDPATPVGRTYCTRLTSEEYEDQASKCTEDALAELIQHLEKNPASYSRIMASRKKEREESGIFSYAKMKLLSLLSGKDCTAVSEEECGQELSKVTTEMVKVFDYSEESKGRRRSKRLAARKLRQSTPLTHRNTRPLETDSLMATPPPPPPPPPPLSCRFTPLVDNTLSRRPLDRKHQVQRNLIQSEPRSRAAPFKQVLQEINCPERRMMLRSTVQRSPGGTPHTGWPKTNRADSNFRFFNTKMADKFKNIRSPVLSPLATPGTFESPVSPD